MLTFAGVACDRIESIPLTQKRDAASAASLLKVWLCKNQAATLAFSFSRMFWGEETP
ncbi:hypothetical protein SAMN05880593_10143 [Rhizobium sp. RU36D]|nr:hypothetical protein SAMN05880593_10143 [Rhizobium sp. RU36D]